MVIVEIAKAHEQLLEYNCNLGLCYDARLHQVCAAAARAEFHDDPQVGASQVGAIVLCDVGRVHARENHDLAHDVVDLVFGIFHVNDLDGDRVARPPVKAFVDFAKAAAAYAFLFGVERVGVDGFVSAYLGGHGGGTGAAQGGGLSQQRAGGQGKEVRGGQSRAAQRGVMGAGVVSGAGGREGRGPRARESECVCACVQRKSGHCEATGRSVEQKGNRRLAMGLGGEAEASVGAVAEDGCQKRGGLRRMRLPRALVA